MKKIFFSCYFLCLLFNFSNAQTVDWVQTGGGTGYDIISAISKDASGNIYATGQIKDSAKFINVEIKGGLFIAKYDSNGVQQMTTAFGNIHAAGKSICTDNEGNIYVTGQAWMNNEQHTVTIKYRTDYFTNPPSVDTPSVAYLFYPNSGQLVDVNDSDVTDSVHYYTAHHYPQLYFGYGVMNMVWNHIDKDYATNDFLQRVDVTFKNNENIAEAYPLNEQESYGYLNYYLPQCPDGITNVYGYGSLLFTNVFKRVDVIYSSNDAGLKLDFVCNNSFNYDNIRLVFKGQENLSIRSNWFLTVHTLLGDYSFEK